MNVSWSFCREDTGEFEPSSRRLPPGEKPTLPPGCLAIEGEYNRHTQRVEIRGEGDERKMTVVDREPVPPDDQHEWDATRGIIRKTAAEIARDWKQREIEAIEVKAGPRAVRDGLRAILPAGPEKQRLDDYEAEIAELRKDLSDTRSDSSSTEPLESERPA